jgi:Cu/Ag efflux protein CusF
MKKIVGVGLALIASVFLFAGAQAAEKKTASVEKHKLHKLTATVEAIDQATRVVTLKGPKGNLVTFMAGDAVKNLAQVQVGDKVQVKYEESLVLRVLKPEEASVNQAGATAMTAQPGEKPAGSAAREVTVTVSIEKIDKKKGTVTFKGPAGGVETIKAEDPKNLDKVKVGDRVAITYTEALAVSLEKVKK